MTHCRHCTHHAAAHNLDDGWCRLCDNECPGYEPEEEERDA